MPKSAKIADFFGFANPIRMREAASEARSCIVLAMHPYFSRDLKVRQ